MEVKFECRIIDDPEKSPIYHSEGYTEEIKDPLMIYAMLPIEREQYIKLQKACSEQKISIFDLLERAINQDPEDLKYQIW